MLIARPDGLWESNFEERLKGCDGGAEMCTFDGVTVVDTVNPEKEVVVITPPSRCETLVKRILEKGAKPEWEVFCPEHILQDVTRLIQKGYDKPPYYINMVLGGDEGLPGRHALQRRNPDRDGEVACRRSRSGAFRASARRSCRPPPRRSCSAATFASAWRTTIIIRAA